MQATDVLVHRFGTKSVALFYPELQQTLQAVCSTLYTSMIRLTSTGTKIDLWCLCHFDAAFAPVGLCCSY